MIDYVKLVKDKTSFIVVTSPNVGTFYYFHKAMKEAGKDYFVFSNHLATGDYSVNSVLNKMKDNPDAVFAFEGPFKNTRIQDLLKAAAEKHEIHHLMVNGSDKFLFTGVIAVFTYNMNGIDAGLQARCRVIHI